MAAAVAEEEKEEEAEEAQAWEWELGRRVGRGEEGRPYLRQLIRDTHIAGQLFKAHSCRTQPQVPPTSLTPPRLTSTGGMGKCA